MRNKKRTFGWFLIDLGIVIMLFIALYVNWDAMQVFILNFGKEVPVIMLVAIAIGLLALAASYMDWL